LILTAAQSEGFQEFDDGKKRAVAKWIQCSEITAFWWRIWSGIWRGEEGRPWRWEGRRWSASIALVLV
jgi:hypothetical protein